MYGGIIKRTFPDLSRFELQCLRKLWSRKEGTVRRVRLEGGAWVYRPEVSASDIIRKEIRRLRDSLFDGAAPESARSCAGASIVFRPRIRGGMTCVSGTEF
jgi:hypothetical protein